MIRLMLLLFFSSTHLFAADRFLAEDEDVFELSLDELLQVTVTSVSKKSQHLADAAAAIYVITNEDIKRTGVSSIPDALRLAPGINVARISSQKWAISSRGFNGSFANKLLVLIDGRSVYSPFFSGVYWDAQDVLLEDVDRIEVIRGPGAAIWGANAVNGVINIISKKAKDTQGGLVVAGGGSEEEGFGALRYGVKLGENSYARAYVKGFEKGEFKRVDGENAGDDWSNVQGGFRFDSQLTQQDTLTLQGDVYHTVENQVIVSPQLTAPYVTENNVRAENAGWNILSRVEHTFSDTANYSLQFYYDHYQRDERDNVLQKISADVLDVEFQNDFILGDRQAIVWGLGYRFMHDNYNQTESAELLPNSRNDQLFSAFIQDEIAVIKDKLFFTLGSKFEHNDYSGFEIQPTARLMWKLSNNQRLWGAVSRAVRTPARAEHDLNLSVQVIAPTISMPFTTDVKALGDPAFKPEELISYEIGYRYELSGSASFDIAAFYHDYDRLVGTRVGSPSIDFATGIVTVPTFFDNSSKAETYGIETSIKWSMLDWWRWDVNYSFLKTQLHTVSEHQQSISPNHQASIRAALSPIKEFNVDVWFRYVGEDQGINAQGNEAFMIDGYINLDLRVAWQIDKTVELSVTGQNLLDSQHLEYRQETYTPQTEIPRGFYGKIEWQF